MTKRESHSPKFKAKVALEAIREEMAMAELSKKYGLHPTQIGTWKRAVIQNMASAFSKRGSDLGRADEAQIDKLHSKLANWCFSGCKHPCQPMGGTGFFSQRLGSVARNAR